MMPLLAGSGLYYNARRTPDKIALRLIGPDGREAGTRSYADLARRMNQAAHATAARFGLGNGDHVAIVAGNCLEYLEVACGLGNLGIAAATPSPRLSTKELVAICDDAGARVVFAEPQYAEALAGEQFRTVEAIISFGPEYEAFIAGADDTDIPESALGAETADFVIPYTSGTTGKPKGVRVSHRSRVLTFHAMAVEYGCFGPDDYFLCIAPLCHGAGLAFGLGPIFFGGTCDLHARFDAETVLRELKQRGHSGVFMVPTHFQALFGLDQAVLAANRPAGLKAIISNAAPLPQATKVKIIDYFGEGLLHECYGSTEAGIVCNMRPDRHLEKPNCVGLPFPGTAVRLLGEDGQPVPRGEVGELYSTSPYLFPGYWQLPEATAEAFRDGWVSAGDLAWQDEDGYIYIVDRKKDMIISGGINIYPREIEEVLHMHPGIRDVAVVGLPDDYWGESVTAFVVREPGADIDEEAVVACCAGELADYKRPRKVIWVDEIPRNPSGKVLKRALRDQYGS